MGAASIRSLTVLHKLWDVMQTPGLGSSAIPHLTDLGPSAMNRMSFLANLSPIAHNSPILQPPCSMNSGDKDGRLHCKKLNNPGSAPADATARISADFASTGELVNPSGGPGRLVRTGLPQGEGPCLGGRSPEALNGLEDEGAQPPHLLSCGF